MSGSIFDSALIVVIFFALMGCGAALIFLWCRQTRQFEDIEGIKYRMLERALREEERRPGPERDAATPDDDHEVTDAEHTASGNGSSPVRRH